MNFHSPIVGETPDHAIPGTKALAKAPRKAPRSTTEVFIPGDPKGRSEAKWRAVKRTSQYQKANAKWRAELDAIADNAAVQFPALGKLMRSYNWDAFRLDCAMTIESELDEAARDKKTGRINRRPDENAISDPIDDLEVKSLLRLVRHHAKSLGEVQALGRYLAKLRERCEWGAVVDGKDGDMIDVLLDGLSGIDSTRPHPDAGLLALKLTFDESKAEAARLNRAYDEGKADGGALDAAYAKTSNIAKRIASTRASTIDGLLVKNVVWEWCRPDDPSTPRYDLGDSGGASTTDMKILAGLMKDLGRMAGPPPSYPEDHPWVAVRRLSTELSAALARIEDDPVMALIKPATEPGAVAWGDLDIFRDMLPLKPVEIEDKGDALQASIDQLRQLVKTITWDMANLEHGHPKKSGERYAELDRVEALVSIVDTLVDKMATDVEEHVTHLYGVANANRINFDNVQKARREPPAISGDVVWVRPTPAEIVQVVEKAASN
ncbi:MAG TPA: hypothetical protein VG757_01845 [Devosia sp.]|nr:hypothetical protein [Devosia sp.]